VFFERVIGDTGLTTPLDKRQWDDLITRYYQLRGWDPKNGRPLRARLEDLGMKNVADKLA
jgi:aldehyde:ferredoxin oxidoreductase